MRLLDETILDHWHCRFDDLQLSSKTFYESIEQALAKSGYPRVTYWRVELGEHIFDFGTREYLKINRSKFDFLICAAPFGKGYFISWWLKQSDGFEVLLKFIPFIGQRLYRAALRQSCFQVDTEIMFKESIKTIVNNCIAELEQSKGMREIGIRETVPQLQ